MGHLLVRRFRRMDALWDKIRDKGNKQLEIIIERQKKKIEEKFLEDSRKIYLNFKNLKKQAGNIGMIFEKVKESKNEDVEKKHEYFLMKKNYEKLSQEITIEG